MTSSPTEKIYASAQGAALEDLLENAQYRKGQIYSMHGWLRDNSETLVEAICTELGWSNDEAIENLNTIIHSAEELYNSLSLQRDLRVERSIRKGAHVSLRSRTCGLGLVIGSSRNPVSSVLLPVLSAIAAGCITVVIPSEGAEKTRDLILKCLADTTDHEGVITARTENVAYLTTQHFDVVALPVDDKYDESLRQLQTTNLSIRVLRPSKGKTFVIVDRSGDVGCAALHVHRAISTRSCLSSLRCPKVCLVDEFVLDAFEEELGQLIATKREPRVDSKAIARPDKLIQGLTRVSKYSAQIGIFGRPEKMSIEVFRDQVSTLFERNERVILVPTTSTEDAIDLINAINHPYQAQVLYIFSKSAEGEYFSKFVRTQQAFVNSIELKSLTAEIPNTPAATLELPYSAPDFSINSPVYQAKSVAKAKNLKSSVLAWRALKKVSRRELLDYSFFERGIVLGLVMILAGTGGSIYAMTRLGIRLLRM